MQLMLKSVVLTIIKGPVLFFATFFLTRACIWAVVKMIWRARFVPHAKVIPKDFGAELFHVFLRHPDRLVLV